MPAGIEKHDRGVVHGDTWHGLEQYITQDHPVSLEQAQDVMCYPLDKKQLLRDVSGNCDYEPVDAWSIIRSDKNIVLVPHVGKRFTVLNNEVLLNFVEKNLLSKYKDLKIESVGTLFNGATAFVNLKFDEFYVKGDDSETISRLLYYNPLGRGSYCACAHDIRVVCNNTLQIAEMQGAANKSLVKFRHTNSAGDKINGHLVNLAELREGHKSHVEMLNELTEVQLDQNMIKWYLDTMYPIPEEEGRSRTIAINKRDSILSKFNSDQGLNIGVRSSAYALLQATTNFLDHDGNIKNGDNASRVWDGIVGQRSSIKNKALNYLKKLLDK